MPWRLAQRPSLEVGYNQPGMAENLECPECHEPIAPDDFQCESCELLLNPQLASGEYVITDPSIVRALLSPPMRTSSREIPAIAQRGGVHDAITARFSMPLDEDTVPYLKAGLGIALQPLHPFEAYVASFIDGNQTVAALAQAAKLRPVEVMVVLKSLFEQKLVELHRQPAPASPEEDLPLLNGAEFLEDAPPIVQGSPVQPKPPPPPPRLPVVTPALRPRAGAASSPSPAPAPKAPAASRTLSPPPAPSKPASPVSRTEDLLQRAVRLEREGQVDKAIELLKRELARVHAPAPLYNKLALILVNQRKDYTQASELLEQAVELEPNNPVFQQNLLKVVGMAASAPGSRAKARRGVLDRLPGRR
jgi:hypothetical protein